VAYRLGHKLPRPPWTRVCLEKDAFLRNTSPPDRSPWCARKQQLAISNWQLAFVFELRSSIPIFKTLGLHGTRSDGFMPKSTWHLAIST
jgi:hypothetical protein